MKAPYHFRRKHKRDEEIESGVSSTRRGDWTEEERNFINRVETLEAENRELKNCIRDLRYHWSQINKILKEE